MKSAKRPLKLVWQNADPMADIYFLSFKFFFKNGDGKILYLMDINKCACMFYKNVLELVTCIKSLCLLLLYIVD